MITSISSIGKKALLAILAALLSTACIVGPAWADSVRDAAAIPDTAQSTSTSTVTGAATRAAMPALEILGINSVEESAQFTDTSDFYQWAQPKYYLMASSFNTSLSPYLANLATGKTATGAVAAVTNAARGVNDSGAGPDAALAAYGTDTTDDEVWDLLPDIIVGDGDDVSYTDSYIPNVSGYSPTGVNYSATDYSALIEMMHAIADAAGANEEGRYGSITAIAQAYEEYIWGIMGAVQEALDDSTSGVKKATVALVIDVTEITNDSDSNSDSDSDSDNSVYSYTLLTSKGSDAGDGTAASNRYLETTSDSGIFDLAENYANEVAPEGADEVVVTASELQENVDLIMVGGQNSSSNYDAIEEALLVDGLMDMTYLVEDNGSQGSMYGVVMNSVENAQNVGRILGCLYPGVISQADAVAYYYDVFYHINSSDLAYVISNAMYGVRNGNVTTSSNSASVTDWVTWSESDVSEYNRSSVQKIIDDGYAYYKQHYLSSSSN